MGFMDGLCEQCSFAPRIPRKPIIKMIDSQVMLPFVVDHFPQNMLCQVRRRKNQHKAISSSNHASQEHELIYRQSERKVLVKTWISLLWLCMIAEV